MWRKVRHKSRKLVCRSSGSRSRDLAHQDRSSAKLPTRHDARARFATRERIPSADELLVAWPEEAVEQVQPDLGTAIVVLTHDDKFDLPMLRAALASDAFYVGALGSRRNQERRRGLLRDAGVSEAELERISGPCGLDVGAESPAETALSMLAEILAARAGRSGGRLKDAPHRIHAEPLAAKK